MSVTVARLIETTDIPTRSPGDDTHTNALKITIQLPIGLVASYLSMHARISSWWSGGGLPGFSPGGHHMKGKVLILFLTMAVQLYWRIDRQKNQYEEGRMEDGDGQDQHISLTFLLSIQGRDDVCGDVWHERGTPCLLIVLEVDERKHELETGRSRMGLSPVHLYHLRLLIMCNSS